MNPETIFKYTPEETLETLGSVRKVTIELAQSIPERLLTEIPAPMMGPILWDVGHVACFEDIWIPQCLGKMEETGKGYNQTYNAVLNPRKERFDMPLPDLKSTLRYMEQVRRKTLGCLENTDFETGDPLELNGFAFWLVIGHECQHQETILQSLALLGSSPCDAALPVNGREDVLNKPAGMVRIPAGLFNVGSEVPGFTYDNEKPEHRVYLDDFEIDAAPVSNERYLAFIDSGGYERAEFWSPAGWKWREESGVEHPLYWMKEGEDWHRRCFNSTVRVNPDEPVIHISFWEAEAFASFESKRLPTEFEWEKAARWDPVTDDSLLFPWGNSDPSDVSANIDRRYASPAPLGSFPQGVSPTGCHQMVGDVYEWTSSTFSPYPGFVAFPYKEYSEIFLNGKYKVLRGASWASSEHYARASYRNWDFPQRRQIFAGFRCARDIT